MIVAANSFHNNRATSPGDRKIGEVKEFGKQSSLALGLESQACHLLCDLGNITNFSEPQSPFHSDGDDKKI